MGINLSAPVIARHEVQIRAPIDLVWRLHADVNRLLLWQPDIHCERVDNSLSVGAVFHRQSLGVPMVHTVQEVETERWIAWRGAARGLATFGVWTLQARAHRVMVMFSESREGELAGGQVTFIQEALHRAMHQCLGSLKRLAEGITALGPWHPELLDTFG